MKRVFTTTLRANVYKMMEEAELAPILILRPKAEVDIVLVRADEYQRMRDIYLKSMGLYEEGETRPRPNGLANEERVLATSTHVALGQGRSYSDNNRVTESSENSESLYSQESLNVPVNSHKNLNIHYINSLVNSRPFVDCDYYPNPSSSLHSEKGGRTLERAYSHTSHDVGVCSSGIITEEKNVVKNKFSADKINFQDDVKIQQKIPPVGNVIQRSPFAPNEEKAGVAASPLAALILPYFSKYPVFQSDDLFLLDHFISHNHLFRIEDALNALSQMQKKGFSPRTWHSVMPWFKNMLAQRLKSESSTLIAPDPVTHPHHSSQRPGLSPHGCQKGDVRHNMKDIPHVYIPKSYERFDEIFEAAFAGRDTLVLRQCDYAFVEKGKMEEIIKSLNIEFVING